MSTARRKEVLESFYRTVVGQLWPSPGLETVDTGKTPLSIDRTHLSETLIRLHCYR